MSNISLSPHFLLKEFVASKTAESHGIDNTPPEKAVENLQALCVHTLEPLREALGHPIIITSGYRCKELNNILSHSSRNSQHMTGQAADFVVQGSKFKVQGEAGDPGSKVKGQSLTPREMLIKAFRTIILNKNINFDQLILYPTFIHISYVSRERNRQKLTRAFANGSYCALTREQALMLE